MEIVYACSTLQSIRAHPNDAEAKAVPLSRKKKNAEKNLTLKTLVHQSSKIMLAQHPPVIIIVSTHQIIL